jgi:hypothetical protein
MNVTGDVRCQSRASAAARHLKLVLPALHMHLCAKYHTHCLRRLLPLSKETTGTDPQKVQAAQHEAAVAAAVHEIQDPSLAHPTH